MNAIDTRDAAFLRSIGVVPVEISDSEFQERMLHPDRYCCGELDDLPIWKLWIGRMAVAGAFLLVLYGAERLALWVMGRLIP